jgi:AcrR family transcriptional regulator
VSAERRDDIVRAALELLEEEGAEALTMRRLADRLGVKAPSLYKHLASKEELEGALMAVGLEQVGSVLAEAARSGGDPLTAIAVAYRRFALAHPHLYRLLTERPLLRERLPEGVEARAAAPLVEAAGDPDRARAAWAFAHGMVHLELSGRFPPDADLDAAWRSGIAALADAPMSTSPARAVVRSWRGPD